MSLAYGFNMIVDMCLGIAILSNDKIIIRWQK